MADYVVHRDANNKGTSFPPSNHPPTHRNPIPHNPPTHPPTHPTDKYFQEQRPAPGVLILMLDRPRKKNAITGAMYLDLAEAMNKAAGDETVTCLVRKVGGWVGGWVGFSRRGWVRWVGGWGWVVKKKDGFHPLLKHVLCVLRLSIQSTHPSMYSGLDGPRGLFFLGGRLDG